MQGLRRRPPVRLGLLLAALVLGLGVDAAPVAIAQPKGIPIDHIVIIFMENRSFDHLFGLFPGADGLARAGAAAVQVDRQGRAYATLPQPLDTCGASTPEGCTYRVPPRLDSRFPADLPNGPFDLGAFVPPDQHTGDLVHKYYANQYQINGGRNDQFVAWSNAGGLTMGYYDLRGSYLWRWASEYTLADRFFQAGFGGSWFNHLWLVCACVAHWPEAPEDFVATPLPNEPSRLQDNIVRPDRYVVNDVLSVAPPNDCWPTRPDQRLPLQTLPHIGDRLDAAGVSWAWYAGGWNDSVAGQRGPLFQCHHQPFVYFANVGGDPAARARRLKDETDFLAALQDGTLPQVAWLKPYGADDQHAGYATVAQGDAWLDRMLRAIQSSPYWPRVAVIVTYDENGGWWDHVAPPVVDEWGPGSRIPALIVSPWARRSFIDHTPYDTTSVLKFIEWRWGLPPLGPRDAAANNLLAAFDFSQPPPPGGAR
jgi:phospholipase C